jgi:uncharacterized protein (DUF2141 family)
MRKNIIILFFLCLFCVKNIYADIPFVIEIHNVTVNGGMVYIGIYTDEESFIKMNPKRIIAIEPNSVTLLQKIQLPEGEYVIGLLQDSNGNGNMDYGMFGIPKEPYGFSNMKDKTPGNYNQLKFIINNSNKRIIIPLVRW